MVIYFPYLIISSDVRSGIFVQHNSETLYQTDTFGAIDECFIALCVVNGQSKYTYKALDYLWRNWGSDADGIARGHGFEAQLLQMNLVDLGRVLLTMLYTPINGRSRQFTTTVTCSSTVTALLK